MTFDEVVRLGELATTGNYNFVVGTWWWWTIGIIMLIITIWSMLEDDFIPAILLWLLLHGIYSWGVSASIESERLEEWKQNIAIPYIETLEVEKHEIVYVKIDPELSSKTTGGLFYTYSTPMYLTPLTVSFKSDGIETITDWHETRMELTNEDEPYIEFIRLKQDLGKNVKKGLYNKKVYLPESYKFTEIK